MINNTFVNVENYQSVRHTSYMIEYRKRNGRIKKSYFFDRNIVLVKARKPFA